MNPTQIRRTALYALIATLCLGALLGIFSILSGNWRWEDLRFLATDFAVSFASLLALGCAVTLERKRVMPLPWIGLGIICISLLWSLGLIWEAFRFEKTSGKLYLLTVVWSFSISHICLLSLPRLSEGWRTIQYGTISIVGLLGLVFSVLVLSEFDDAPWRLITILVILDGCGSIIVPIGHKISSLPEQGEGTKSTMFNSISMTCPSCSNDIVVPSGHSQCSHCGLGIAITLDRK